MLGLGLLFVALASFGVSAAGGNGSDKTEVDPAALERTRESIKMLDDLYKNAVVIITKTYTEKQADTPAAVVAIELFEAMHKKDWHSARLVDATGKPKRRANAPKTDFEIHGVEQMNAGKAYFEEIGEKDGKPVLRVATVVPALMPQCVTCHGGKPGRVLGAIVYELPIK
jgi:hypothetical protein